MPLAQHPAFLPTFHETTAQIAVLRQQSSIVDLLIGEEKRLVHADRVDSNLFVIAVEPGVQGCKTIGKGHARLVEASPSSYTMASFDIANSHRASAKWRRQGARARAPGRQGARAPGRQAEDTWFTGDHEKLGVNAVGVYQPFFLAYQEVNNRALLSQYGDLCCRLMGTWQKTQGVAPTATGERSGSFVLGSCRATCMNIPSSPRLSGVGVRT